MFNSVFYQSFNPGALANRPNPGGLANQPNPGGLANSPQQMGGGASVASVPVGILSGFGSSASVASVPVGILSGFGSSASVASVPVGILSGSGSSASVASVPVGILSGFGGASAASVPFGGATSCLFGTTSNFGGGMQLAGTTNGANNANALALTGLCGNTQISPFGLNNINSYSAGPTTQNSLNPDMVKTGMGGKSLLSANFYEKQIDNAYADGDKFSDKAHEKRLEKNRLGEEISGKLRYSGYSNNSRTIMDLRSKYARLEKEIALNDNKAAQAYQRASTAMANRNNALDGLTRESNPTNASTNPLMQFLNQLMAFLFGTNDKQNLETVMGGGNRLAGLEYSKDIDKIQIRIDKNQEKLDRISKEKEELGNLISDQLRNYGASNSDLSIVTKREKWDMLALQEKHLSGRIATDESNLATLEAKRDPAINANVSSGDSIARIVRNNAALLGG